jgi:hypothetical protein
MDLIGKRLDYVRMEKTKKLFDTGYYPDEIAESLGQPLEKVNAWISMIEQERSSQQE